MARRSPGRTPLPTLVLRATALAAATVALLWFTPTPWLLRAPGEARDVLTMVRIEGRAVPPTRDRLYLTTILVEPASALFCLYAVLDPDAELADPGAEDLQPVPGRRPGPTAMAQSQYLAKVAALRQLGYRIEARAEGVELVEVRPDSPAAGLLQAGDVVVRIGDRPALRVEDLRAALQSAPAGRPLDVEVRRRGHRLVLHAPTGDREGHAYLGVAVRTRVRLAPLPFRIDIDAEGIDGASAGLLFALAIYDDLTPGDLAGGIPVAGTGTMDEDGRVGGILGVDMKVKAAQRIGAAFFLCPRENAAEARAAASTLEVVPVGTFGEALQALARMGAGAPKPAAGGKAAAEEK